MSKGSKGGGFKSSGGSSFKGSSGGGFKSSGGSFRGPSITPMSGGMRTTGGMRTSSSSQGNTRISGFAILVIAILIAAWALLRVELTVLIGLFVASVLGILVMGVFKKYVPTPEDTLREATIKQFQVPNTKEALLEFSILATGKIRPVNPLAAMLSTEAKQTQWNNRLWLEKCESIYTRARLAMKDDAGSLAEVTRLMQKAGVKV